MALTFTPDNRALNGMPGCGICGIYGQVLYPVIDEASGQQIVVEVDPDVFYAQMANDYAAAAAEVDAHIISAHSGPRLAAEEQQVAAAGPRRPRRKQT